MLFAPSSKAWPSASATRSPSSKKWMSPSPTSASAAVEHAPRSGVRSRPTSTAAPSKSSKPKKALPTVPQFSPASALACGLPSMPPATPPFAWPRASIPNPPPWPPSTPAIPPSAASIPPPAKSSTCLPEGTGFLLAPCLSMDAFGGFLGRRPHFRRSISTTYQEKPCPFDGHGGNPIGVGGETAPQAGVPLRLVSRSVAALGTAALLIPGLVEISREGIKRHQENRGQHDRRISHPVRRFFLLEQVADCRAQEKNLQPGEDASGDLHERILMKQRNHKNRSADHRRHQAHQHREHVSLHRISSSLGRRSLPLSAPPRAEPVSRVVFTPQFLAAHAPSPARAACSGYSRCGPLPR